MTSETCRIAHEESLFLAEHKALSLWCERFAEAWENGERTDFSVVCERKEDLIPLRREIHRRLRVRLDLAPEAPLAGITMHTVDNLVGNMTHTLANNPPDRLRALGVDPALLSKTTLDIPTQETLAQLLFQSLGIPSNEALAIGRQCLALLDVLPPGLPLHHALADIFADSASSGERPHLTERTFLTLAAGWTMMQQVFSHYTRVQELIAKVIGPHLLTCAKMHMNPLDSSTHLNHFPTRLFRSTMLWVEAPAWEWVDGPTPEDTPSRPFKPGNMQPQLLEDLQSTLRSLFDLFARAHGKNTGFFFISRTIFKVPRGPSQTPYAPLQVKYAHNAQDFVQGIQAALETKGCFTALGDVKPAHAALSEPHGAGVWVIPEHQIQKWFAANRAQERIHEFIYPIEKTEEEIPPNTKDIQYQIDEKLKQLFDEFLHATFYLGPFDILKSIADKLNIPCWLDEEKFIDLFARITSEKEIDFRTASPFQMAEKPLSFFPGEEKALRSETLCVIGRVHSPTQPAFTVRILNALFYELRRKGVGIELIASDLPYKGYWHFLLSRFAGKNGVVFLLPPDQTWEDFPTWLTSQAKPLLSPLRPAPTHSLLGALDKRSQLALRPLTPKGQVDKTPSGKKRAVSVTAFEKYIKCPFPYWLENILGLSEDLSEHMEATPLVVGQLAHSIFEKTLLMCTTKSPYATAQQCLHFFKSLSLELKSHAHQIDFAKEAWKNSLLQVGREQLTTSDEVLVEWADHLCQSLFDPVLKSPLGDALRQVEIARIFVRFLDWCHLRAQENPETWFRNISINTLEKRVEMDFGNLHLVGKIDLLEIAPDGVSIVDYKTSKPNSSDITCAEKGTPSKKHTIWPREAMASQDKHLFAQGAMYALILASELEKNPLVNVENNIKEFHYVRLKTWHELVAASHVRIPIAPTGIDVAPFNFKSDNWEQLKSEYLPFAERLFQGDFAPRPLQGDQTCTFCQWKAICPLQSTFAEEESAE